MEQITD